MPEKILVVDDDVDTLRLVGLMLQRQGYQIVAANNGSQALTMAEGENPDLVLLDVMMPDMDGYEVTRRLRAAANTASTPIIMFTAKSQVDDKVAGFEAGVDDYLTKPTQPRELFAHVKAVLARSGKTPPTPSQSETKRERGYVIGVLAAKGGLGVSTLAVNLGVSLRIRARKDVIIAEFRPGEGSIGLDLGYLQPEGLERLLRKRTSEIQAGNIENELIAHKTDVRILASSYKPSDAKYQNEVDKFEIIAQHLSRLAHYNVLDLGPALSPMTDRILPICDELVVVLEPSPYVLQRTQLLMDELIGKGYGEGRLNAVLYTRQRSELQLTLPVVQNQFKHPISVVFTPAPELVYQSARANTPLVVQHPDNLTTQQFFKLADNITRHVQIKEE